MSRTDIHAGPADPDFLRPWREPVSPKRVLRSAVGSVAVHLLIATLLMLPGSPPPPTPVAGPDLSKAVHLTLPRDLQLTQKAPNQGKVTRELDVRSAVQTPVPQAPRFLPPVPPPGPVAPPQPRTPVPAIEPPKIEIAESAPPPPPSYTPLTPPAPPPPERPKLAFESVGSGSTRNTAPNTSTNPVIQTPNNTVQEAVRAAVQPGGGGISVGDIGDDLADLPSLRDAPLPGRMGSNLQLLSDPSGVDFKPYLLQVLAAVRRNWMAIIPESAHMGRRGRVLIQFIIDRRGAVPKLVIATASGTEAFDRAAVAGISASYPFPPLPADFKGDQIRLQLAFSYNIPAR